jgi:hypothetical protein
MTPITATTMRTSMRVNPLGWPPASIISPGRPS